MTPNLRSVERKKVAILIERSSNSDSEELFTENVEIITKEYDIFVLGTFFLKIDQSISQGVFTKGLLNLMKKRNRYDSHKKLDSKFRKAYSGNENKFCEIFTQIVKKYFIKVLG